MAGEAKLLSPPFPVGDFVQLSICGAGMCVRAGVCVSSVCTFVNYMIYI